MTVSAEPEVRVGRGVAPGHHGELLQGIFDDAGRPTLGLVTLPLDEPGARATFRPDRVGDDITVEVTPTGRTRAQRAATSLLRHLHEAHGAPAVSGRLRLRGHLPVGLGLGSSSADVVAAMRAAGDAVGLAPDAVAMCQVAAEIEGACDPLPHLPQVVLFAQREGRVIEDFGVTHPPVVVVSCETGGGHPVETEGCLRPDPSETATYEQLRARLRRGLLDGDVEAVGMVAAASADLHQERLPKRELPALLRASRRHGGVGVQIAHSGNVAGVLFCARSVDVHARARRCAASLEADGVVVRAVLPPGRRS